MSEMYPNTPPTGEMSAEEASDLAQLQELKAPGSLRQCLKERQAAFEGPHAAPSDGPGSGNGVVQPAPKPGLLSSQLITIRWFPPAMPEAEAGFANEYYKATLAEFGNDPDLVLRLAAVDADRIHEPAIWEAVRAADIVVVYELAFPEMYVVSGIRTWEALMRGDIKTPTVILPLCTYLEPHEFQATVLLVRNAKGGRTCEGCGSEI